MVDVPGLQLYIENGQYEPINEVVDLKIVKFNEQFLKTDSDMVCDDGINDWEPKCGRHNPEGYKQTIVNLDSELHESQFGEWPNMCAIHNEMEIAGKKIRFYQGGASLISPRFLLTAAHKVHDISNIIVR